MSEKTDLETIHFLQNDSDYIILNNPLVSPKFIRMIGKEKEMTITDTYTPKIFYEIVSRLTPEDLNGIKENQSIKIDINIPVFLKEIGANGKNYKHLITSIEALQTVLFKWKENDSEHRSSIINYSIHDSKSGKVQIQIHEKMVRHILEVKQKENFSFLKTNIFRLQNAQAIRLYPFFEKWLNSGKYVTDLERFKNDFGYNTSGYRFYTNLEKKVLLPAIEEINEKTNLLIKFETTGDNLDSTRPRVKGLVFIIKTKSKITQTLIQKGLVFHEEILHKESSQQKEISALYSIFVSLRFDIGSKLPRDVAEATLMQWLEINGYDSVYNGLMRAKDTFKQEIKNPLGFFGGDYFQNNKHYLKQKQEAKQLQQREKEAKEKKELSYKLLNTIIEDFRKREAEHFIKLFNQLNPEEKIKQFELIKTNRNYYENGEITKFGIYAIGKTIAESTTYDAQKTIQNLAKRDYNTSIYFDKEGKPFIKDNDIE